jgi:hypothetical protein
MYNVAYNIGHYFESDTYLGGIAYVMQARQICFLHPSGFLNVHHVCTLGGVSNCEEHLIGL